MILEQDKEKFCSDVANGKLPVVAAYPIVARGVFGSSPEEVLKNTRGRVVHFYYIFFLAQYVMAPFILWLTPENMDSPIRNFLIEYLGFRLDNWISGALLIALCIELALAISLRVLLFPVGSDGKAGWR